MGSVAEQIPSIPSGSYELSAEKDDALRQACNAPERNNSQRAHPVFAFVMGLGGMGMTIREVTASLGLDFDNGAILGKCEISYQRPLLVGLTYDVSAQIADVAAKPSRRFGATHHVKLRMAMTSGGAPFARLALTMIVPDNKEAGVS